MSKGIKDPILSALRSYERTPEQGGKKAVLLTPEGGYFLYGNRFCGIRDYELELRSDGCQIESGNVLEPLFIGAFSDKLHVTGARPCVPEFVSLIFHIDLGEEDGLLRGILLARAAEARFALFCDAAVEELYRFSRRADTRPTAGIPPDELLRQQAEELRRADLHGLTGLYLQSRRLDARAAAELLDES